MAVVPGLSPFQRLSRGQWGGAVEVRTDVTGQAQSIATPNIGAVRN